MNQSEVLEKQQDGLQITADERGRMMLQQHVLEKDRFRLSVFSLSRVDREFTMAAATGIPAFVQEQHVATLYLL